MAASTAKRQPKVTPTFQPDSREELERRRHGVIAQGPSGAVYRIRAINLQRHALSGGLPERLRQLAMQGARGLNRILAAADEEVNEVGETVRDYMDNLVLATIMEPELTKDDLGTGALDDDPLLHPADYVWAFQIAMREEDRDGDGRLLWGKEPLDRFQTFREEHVCENDCVACQRVIERFSAALGAPIGT